MEKTWQNEVPYFELKNIYTTLSVPITDEYRTLVLSIEQNVSAGLSVENCQIQKDGNKLLVTFVISIFQISMKNLINFFNLGTVVVWLLVLR